MGKILHWYTSLPAQRPAKISAIKICRSFSLHCFYLIDHYPTMVVWRRWGQSHFMENRCSIVYKLSNAQCTHYWRPGTDEIWKVNMPRSSMDFCGHLLLRAPSWNAFFTKSESVCQRQAKPISLKWHGLCLDPSRENKSQRHFPSSHVLVHSRFRRSPAHIVEQFYAHVWSW